MRTAKHLRLGAVVATLGLALTACGGGADTGGETDTGTATGTSTETSTEAGTEGAAAGEYDLITDGTLTVCSDIPYAPFEFEGDDGEFTGFDIELIRAVGDELGLDVEVKALGFDAIQSGTALNSDQCDVAASAMTITEEREENLDFTEPYYAAEQSLLAPTDGGIASIDDLAGQTLGVQSATTGADYAKENAPEDTEIKEFENPGDLFTALRSNQIVAILQDLPVNAEFARENDGFEIVETYETGENYGFAVQEEGNDQLLEDINAALQSLRDAGTYDELFDKYFSAE